MHARQLEVYLHIHGKVMKRVLHTLNALGQPLLCKYVQLPGLTVNTCNTYQTHADLSMK